MSFTAQFYIVYIIQLASVNIWRQH